MERTIIKTADGSHSLFVKDLNEHYHSIHGAIQESKHIFINAGLKEISSQNKTSINVLEIGFGTGLNALLTCIEAEGLPATINYTALEAFPISIDLAKELNYPGLLYHSGHDTMDNRNSGENHKVLKDKINLTSVFNQLHNCESETEISISKWFTFNKIINTLQTVEFKNTFDLIYFDAFGPPVQPEMWTEKLFAKLFSVTNWNGCLVTYCAKGEVKRTLKKVGFVVESLDGPPGKREMVRARKN